MRVLKSGHRYELANLRDRGATVLQFYQDGSIHRKHVEGPSCQEVIRALIDRVQYLDTERHWAGNVEIIHHLRCALAGFEARAIIRKAEKGQMVENWPVGDDGHIREGIEHGKG